MHSSQRLGRFSTKKSGQNFGKSRSEANVVGYERRQARKKTSASTTSDLYEHIPEKSRRSEVGLDLGRDEASYTVGLDDASEEEREQLRVRLIGENDEEEVASEDDEEIDSDAAFEESDEEKFAEFFSSKKTKTKPAKNPKIKPAARFAEVNLSEDEDVGSDDNDESEEESEEGSEDEKMDIVPSDDEEVPQALDQLQDFVSNLDATAKKRKAPEEDGTASANPEARSRRRRLSKEKTEAGEENEFRTHSSGSKLNLDDFLAPLSSQPSALQSLRKSTKVLAPSLSSKAETLSAPLPQRTQERLDRQAAYEQTKEEVDKWSDTMRRIREAEHLSFPLQAQSSGRVSNLELNAKFKPTTELETAVDALLKSARMREEDIHHTEDAMLKMNNLSVEEVAQRRAELRRMRELTFRAEIKARRVSKIKSKTYRKLKRKEKERLEDKINKQEDSEDEEGKLKKELDRARERATLRHKHTGKWARQMRNKEGLDVDSRRNIEEMLARGERLRRRINGLRSDEEEGESASDDDDGDDDGMDPERDMADIKQGAFDELRRLGEGNFVEENDTRMGKSVFGMKFMKDAMGRQSEASNREVDDFIKEMTGHVGEGNGSDEEDEELQDLDSSSGVLASQTGGRLVFHPATTTSHPSSRPLASLASDTSSVTLKSTDLLSPPSPIPPTNRLSEPSKPLAQDSNPWLARDTSGSSKAKLVKQVNEVIISKESKAADKLKNKVRKMMLKRAEEREKATDDALVEISVDSVLMSTSPTAFTSKNAHQTKTTNIKKCIGQPAGDPNDSYIDLEIEAQEQELSEKGKKKVNGLKAFEQRDLVALAFAGDNVVESFELAKKREIASDAPRDVDTTIPGWGSWGGSGTHKVPPKPQQIKKLAGIDPTTRADYNKKNIIISEKRDKKAGKYLVRDLPYPYTSKVQFEHAMEHPLGVEWNTRIAFQRGTLPKVVKKPGIVINPMEKQHL